MEKARPGTKSNLANLRSVSLEIRVAVFSLNAGGSLMLAGIYAGINPRNTGAEVPLWLVIAVATFSIGVLVFLVSQFILRAVLRWRIWGDQASRVPKVLADVGVWCVVNFAWLEGGCLLVGAAAVVSGFIGVSWVLQGVASG